MSIRVTLVSANIGRGVKPSVTRENIRRIHHGFPGAVIGWQEIDEADEADEHAILARVFADHDNIGFAKAVPISIPKPWAVVEGSAVVTHACDWLAHATPDRWIVEAVAQHPDLAEPVRFANGHYPLARLGGNEGRARWTDCQAAWEARATAWHRSGITTLTTRDTNRLRNMPRLHPSERQLLPNAITRITAIPGSVGVKVLDRRDVNLTIDGHSARGVDLLLTVKENQ